MLVLFIILLFLMNKDLIVILQKFNLDPKEVKEQVLTSISPHTWGFVYGVCTENLYPTDQQFICHFGSLTRHTILSSSVLVAYSSLESIILQIKRGLLRTTKNLNE